MLPQAHFCDKDVIIRPWRGRITAGRVGFSWLFDTGRQLGRIQVSRLA